MPQTREHLRMTASAVHFKKEKEMKTKLATACAAALIMASGAEAFDIKTKLGDADAKLKIYGFYQLEARGGEGYVGENADGIKFGAQRIRWGMNYSTGNIGAKLFLDFNQAHDTKKVGMVDMMKDAFLFYKFDKAATIKAGLIKMPHGMGFTIPGWNLDIAERGFDKQLSGERNVGLMLSGRAIGGEGKVTGFEMGHERPWTGFGYDIMIANPAGRSGAVKAGDELGSTTSYSTSVDPGVDALYGTADDVYTTEATTSQAKEDATGYTNSYAVRVMYDMGEALHIEASQLVSPYAGGIVLDSNDKIDKDASTEDYTSTNVGIDSHLDALNLKVEMYDAQNINGVKDYTEQTQAVTATYALNENYELAGKHIMGKAEKDKKSTSLTNTYLGVNIFLEPFTKTMSRSDKRKRNAHKVVLNYVTAGGDTDTWNGLKGIKETAWIAQYQMKF
jgi:hypothetical protein